MRGHGKKGKPGRGRLEEDALFGCSSDPLAPSAGWSLSVLVVLGDWLGPDCGQPQPSPYLCCVVCGHPETTTHTHVSPQTFPLGGGNRIERSPCYSGKLSLTHGESDLG